MVGTGQPPPQSSYSDTQVCQAVGGLKPPSLFPFSRATCAYSPSSLESAL